VVGEGELSAGMRPFAPADGPGPGRPGREVEVLQLADGGALALLAGLGDRRYPGVPRRGQDRVAHRGGEVEADREADLQAAELVHELVGGAAGVGSGQHGHAPSPLGQLLQRLQQDVEVVARMLAPALPGRSSAASASPLSSR
jgi:hypothetical protein